ncbi:hypothetical protein BX666DRAFT_1926439 [Dichotomocladium elegans]|nr:hypothetical protein BX666DRAFT_1926439 [Dichotomocladium elegans]
MASLEKYLGRSRLALVPDPTKGRKVIATSFIERGSVVITSQPLGTVPLEAHKNEFCNYCFRKLGTTATLPLKRCSRCKSAYFCDMGCFKNAWLSYHQFVCQPSRDNDDDDQSRDLEMLERVALNVTRFYKRKAMMAAKAEEPRNDAQAQTTGEESIEVTMEAFESLMDHLDKHPRHLLAEQYDLLAEEALLKPYLDDTMLTKADLIRFLGIFRCNNFSIYDEQLFAVGEGTYPIASLFNHDCRPNAVAMFDGALLQVKAIDTVEPGEEITLAYIDIAHSRRVRQQTLQDKYYFKCKCDRCQDDSNIIGRIDGMLGEEASDWERAAETLSGGNQREKILGLVETSWDLPRLTQTFNRHYGDVPDPSEALSLPVYVHFLLPLLTPYLWSTSNPSIDSSNRSGISSAPLECQTEFEDPDPFAARPNPGDSYLDILGNAIEQTLSYPPAEIIPYRITTLATCTRLFFDEMMESHWCNATKLGMYILVQYAIIYPPYHPMLAQHLLLLSKSAWNSSIQHETATKAMIGEKGQECDDVRRWILLAKETIQCTFGKQSSMWHEIIELERIFIQDQKLKR